MDTIFGDLANALLGLDDNENSTGNELILERATLDFKRETRKGIPEIIYAERKHPDDVLIIAQKFLEEGSGRAIVSRAKPELQERLITSLATVCINDVTFRVHGEVFKASGTVVLRREDVKKPVNGGHVGVLTAGTSDAPVAEESAVIASEMGCTVTTVYDVGVAGLHRLFKPLQVMISNDVDVIIVAAGMDGALPSVIAGLVSVPVIGLPTSVGYGLGGKGVAALLSMLQTCAPGLTVVNIDNGVGAGATAALTANRMALFRNNSAKK